VRPYSGAFGFFLFHSEEGRGQVIRWTQTQQKAAEDAAPL